MGNGVTAQPYEYEFVARRDTASSMAAAFVGYVHRQPRMWLTYAVFYAACVTLVKVAVGGRVDTAATSTVWAAAAVVSVPTTGLVALTLVSTIYARTVRFARTYFSAGTVVRTGFGSDALSIDVPLVGNRLAYEALRTIGIGRRFVFINLRGQSTLWTILPREVVPDVALARIAEGLGRRVPVGEHPRYGPPGR